MNPFRYGPHLLLSGYTLVGIFTVPAQTGPGEKLASITGIVTNQVSREGLRKAYLRLAPERPKPGSAYAAVTDGHGAFTIDNIAPGNYQLSAEHIGFLDAQYGGASNNSGVVLRLAAGDKLNGIEIKLVPQAVLSGTVLDSDGDPWQHGYVILFRSAWENGRRKMESSQSSGVDDQGGFRMAGLEPGRYYVVAESQPYFEDQYHPDVNGKPTPRHQPTWYPSAPDIDSALPITVGAGQQLSGIDIRLRTGLGSKFSIRGRASGISGVARPQNVVRIFAMKRSTLDPTGPHTGDIR
ncbi:MAG: carboxypeptidase regulatory-like domain-containing protein, partial [Bryobacterales bacterium]|nr:carboxypeptidase regulatory-like domain-containing protein [Bryobacterales bacterium]